MSTTLVDINWTKTPKVWTVPFRGSTLDLRDSTPADVLAIIAQVSLADPRIDAFFEAAGISIYDTKGNVVWPENSAPPESTPEEDPEGNGIIDLLAEL